MAIFLRRDVLAPSFANAVCQLGAWAVIYGFLPLLARQLGAGEVSVGLLVTTALAANAATNLVMTVTSRRGSPPWILHGSFVLFAAGILVAAVGRTIPLLFVATAAMGAANGFFFPLLGVLADAMGIRAMFVIVAIFCVVAANVLIAFHPRLPTTTASDTLAADDQIHLRS